jgi:3-methyladenine DNA glycosylase AlkD
MNTACERFYSEFRQGLHAAGDPGKKQWWENYMRGAIPFIGVGIPEIRILLRQHYREFGLAETSLDDRIALFHRLIDGSVSEEKLAAILLVQNFIGPAMGWRGIVRESEKVFGRRAIFDWNVCDWYCLRLLAPVLKQNGADVAQVLLRWTAEDDLWQARAGLVPFIAMADEIAGRPYINEAADNLICRQERFAKSAVAWIMHDVYKHDADFVKAFIRRNLRHFTRESLRNSLKYAPKEDLNLFISRLISLH